MKSMAEIDASIARAGTIREAEGPENEKALTKLASDGYASVEQFSPYRPAPAF